MTESDANTAAGWPGSWQPAGSAARSTNGAGRRSAPHRAAMTSAPVEGPRVEAPSTESPSTESPSIEARSTEARSTEARSTEARSTEARSTEAAGGGQAVSAAVPPRPVVGAAAASRPVVVGAAPASKAGRRRTSTRTKRVTGRLSRRRMTVAVLVAAFVGADLAGLTTAVTTDYRATSLVDLSSALSAATGSVGSADVADRFVQSELLFLNSATFADQVRSANDLDQRVAIEAAQQGNTDVVAISADASSDDEAERLSASAVDLYADYRRSVITENLPALQQQLDAAQQDLQDAGATSSADLLALQSRFESLAAQVDQIQATSQSPGAGGTVVETAASAGAVPTLSPFLGAAAGAALAALAALLVLGLPRVLSRRILAVDDVRGLGLIGAVPELPVPRVDSAQAWSSTLRGDDVNGPARLLAARLLTARETELLAVVGVEAGGDAGFAAAALAVASAERRPTVLVAADDTDDAHIAECFGVDPAARGLVDLPRDTAPQHVTAMLRPSGIEGLQILPVGRTGGRRALVEDALAHGAALVALQEAGLVVVVDCPRTDVSTCLVDMARSGPEVVLVAGLGRTGEDDLADAAEQVAGAALPTPHVLLTVAQGRRGRT